MDKKLYEALVYAYELLKEQAETGHYPVNALAENGGKGYEPITTALRTCEGEYLNENSGLNIPVVRVMLPDNAVPHDIAKEFADKKLKVVNGMLDQSYKTGYREGITHYLEDKGN